MKKHCATWTALALGGTLIWTGCDSGTAPQTSGESGGPAASQSSGSRELVGEKYTIVDTRTDNFDYSRAKANAEDAMTAHGDLKCMVGLFAYNIPACFEAVKEAGKLGQIQLVSFDEQDAVLEGIRKGEIHGTVSQQPYQYGYQSVKVLKALAAGDNSVIPEKKFIEVGIQVVRKDNVDAFWENLKGLQAQGEGAEKPRESGKPEFAYVTNGIDPFWNNAAAGVRAAEKEFGVRCDVLMPPKGIVDQKRMIETLLAQGVKGIAISPIDAANQVGQINEAAGVTKVITHDSDAPDSNRLCFIGMDNYKAGREAGKLVKEALPEGGKVMIFVGRLEQLNAMQRRQGVIDELLDRPVQSLDSLKFD